MIDLNYLEKNTNYRIIISHGYGLLSIEGNLTSYIDSFLFIY